MDFNWDKVSQPLTSEQKALVESSLESSMNGESPEGVRVHEAYGSHFRIIVIAVPPTLGTVLCRLYGPIEGDEPEEAEDFQVQGAWKVAPVVHRPPREGRFIVAIAHRREHKVVIYAAYGSLMGAVAPRLPSDPSISSFEEIEESRSFWATHALCERDWHFWAEVQEVVEESRKILKSSETLSKPVGETLYVVTHFDNRVVVGYDYLRYSDLGGGEWEDSVAEAAEFILNG